MIAEKVLVVDDDRFVRKVVCRALESFYQTITAENGEQGISKATDEKPDFVLLDVEMPGLNGYEVCDRLKHDPQTQEIPVIFLSSHADIRARMLGYEAGAADFLVKPFEPEELLAKLRVLGQLQKDRDALGQRAKAASDTAFMAMRGSSELGMAIQFIEATYNSESFDSIARHFFDVLAQLQLKGTLLFRTRNGYQYFASQNEVPPLERDVIKTLYESGNRFNDFGCRTQINYSRVALLIKNMPLNDHEAYGRYKDFLPTMLGSTDAKIKALDTEIALADQTRNLTQSFKVVRNTLVEVGLNLQSTQHEVLGVLRDTIDQLDRRIPTLGLEDDQEKYLIDTLDEALHSTHGIIESGENARGAFQTVCRLLDHLADRQESLLRDVTESPDDMPHAGGASEDNLVTGDVELF